MAVSLGRSWETESVRVTRQGPEVGMVMLTIPSTFLG